MFENSSDTKTKFPRWDIFPGVSGQQKYLRNTTFKLWVLKMCKNIGLKTRVFTNERLKNVLFENQLTFVLLFKTIIDGRRKKGVVKILVNRSMTRKQGWINTLFFFRARDKKMDNKQKKTHGKMFEDDNQMNSRNAIFGICQETTKLMRQEK